MKKNSKTRRITFRINETLYNVLEKGMDETGCGISEVLRNIIIDYKRFIKRQKELTF